MTESTIGSGAPQNEIGHMRDAVFFEGRTRPQKLSRYWLLLTLASVIATAGVVGNSDATVIGAMIVAPLMTPILGIMLAVILADWSNLVRSVLLVVAGVVVAIAIGYLVGVFVPSPVDAADNAEVASRVTPGLISLLAAIATGAVGSIALVRSDISDTLPGVAISISLVPPLTVVGLTLESHQPSQAGGAMLLFLTNVTAILVAGVVVMGMYRVHRHAVLAEPGSGHRVNRRTATVIIAAMVLIVAIPLTQTSVTAARDFSRESSVRTAVTGWAGSVGWEVAQVSTQQGTVVVRLDGPLPVPDSAADKASLRAALVAHGVDPATVSIGLVPQATIRY